MNDTIKCIKKKPKIYKEIQKNIIFNNHIYIQNNSTKSKKFHRMSENGNQTHKHRKIIKKICKVEAYQINIFNFSLGT